MHGKCWIFRSFFKVLSLCLWVLLRTIWTVKGGQKKLACVSKCVRMLCCEAPTKREEFLYIHVHLLLLFLRTNFTWLASSFQAGRKLVYETRTFWNRKSEWEKERRGREEEACEEEENRIKNWMGAHGENIYNRQYIALDNGKNAIVFTMWKMHCPFPFYFFLFSSIFPFHSFSPDLSRVSAVFPLGLRNSSATSVLFRSFLHCCFIPLCEFATSATVWSPFFATRLLSILSLYPPCTCIHFRRILRRFPVSMTRKLLYRIKKLPLHYSFQYLTIYRRVVKKKINFCSISMELFAGHYTVFQARRTPTIRHVVMGSMEHFNWFIESTVWFAAVKTISTGKTERIYI